METNELSKETRDEISFMTFIIPEFAAAYKMNVQEWVEVYDLLKIEMNFDR